MCVEWKFLHALAGGWWATSWRRGALSGEERGEARVRWALACRALCRLYYLCWPGAVGGLYPRGARGLTLGPLELAGLHGGGAGDACRV